MPELTIISSNFKGGQAPVQKHMDTLLKYVVDGKLKLDDIITHRLPLSEVEYAKIFRHKEDDSVTNVLKS